MNDMFKNLENNTIQFEKKTINIIIDNDEIIWFNGNEISTSLGYKHPKIAIRNNVDNENKIQLENMNINYKVYKHPHSIYINESGLYSLMMTSQMEKAKKFKNWIIKIVLPSIRKFGYYKLKKEHETDMHEIMKKINFLEKENDKLKNELKTEKYPDGALVYIVDYTDEQPNIYRLGKTNNLNKRKKIYDTHTIYKKKIILKREVPCPIQYEICLRSMLYSYRIKNRKDFYECTAKKIEDAFENCDNSLKCMNQKGGSNNVIDMQINLLNEKLNKIQSKINKYDKKINK